MQIPDWLMGWQIKLYGSYGFGEYVEDMDEGGYGNMHILGYGWCSLGDYSDRVCLSGLETLLAVIKP